MHCEHPKMKIEGTASIGSKWQIVIPKNVREKFDLKVWSDLVILSSSFATILIKSENLKEMLSHFENIIEQSKDL
jgi:AbrB family looped-hinge helix DNA binding protein